LTPTVNNYIFLLIMFKGLIVSARPPHWVKNLILFEALIFAESYSDTGKVITTVIAFIAFCLASSAIYIINDIFDRENDKKHPIKSMRPIASGTVSTSAAVFAGIILLIVSIALSWKINLPTMMIVISYLVLNLSYSVVLKNIVIIDVMCISAGFVLRAVAGAVAIDVRISPWLLVCTTLLALFLAFGKRRHEINLLSDSADSHRKSLKHYSLPFLDQVISVVTASTVVSYALYTLSPDTVEHFGTPWLILTFPFVLYGVFRYLFLLFHLEKGGNPTRLLATDFPLLINIALWLLSVVLVVNFT
jgi:4-hydroxybenzoate polyprenyltransferase